MPDQVLVLFSSFLILGVREYLTSEVLESKSFFDKREMIHFESCTTRSKEECNCKIAEVLPTFIDLTKYPCKGSETCEQNIRNDLQKLLVEYEKLGITCIDRPSFRGGIGITCGAFSG